MKFVLFAAATLLVGCGVSNNAAVGQLQANCHDQSNACSSRCRDNYSEPMQLQHCQDTCFYSQNQCYVEQLNKPPATLNPEN